MFGETDSIEVKIALKDLKELKDLAYYYKSASEERDMLRKEVAELKNQIAYTSDCTYL